MTDAITGPATGPVQLLTLEVDEPRASEAVLRELEVLQDAGTIRVLDVLYVRAADGTVDSLDGPAGAVHDGSVLTSLLSASEDDVTPDGAVWRLDDVVTSGRLAALVLVEHLWAESLVTAMRSSGGRLLDEFWLTSDDREALNALLADR